MRQAQAQAQAGGGRRQRSESSAVLDPVCQRVQSPQRSPGGLQQGLRRGWASGKDEGVSTR